MPIIEMRADFRRQPFRPLSRLCKRRRRNVPFIGKVDRRLGQCRDLDQPRPPALIELRQRPRRLRQRLPALGFRLRFDEIAKTFDLGQVHLAILEAAPREFARFRQAASFDCSQRTEDGSDRSPAPMPLELGDVFSCFAVGCREPQHHRTIERFPGVRMPDGPERCDTRLRNRRRHRLQYVTDGRTGNTNDGQSRTSRCARKRKDS